MAYLESTSTSPIIDALGNCECSAACMTADKEEVADKEEAGQNTSMTGSRAIDKKPAAKSQWGMLNSY